MSGRRGRPDSRNAANKAEPHRLARHRQRRRPALPWGDPHSGMALASPTSGRYGARRTTVPVRLWLYRGRVGARARAWSSTWTGSWSTPSCRVRARKDLVRVAGGYWIAEADTAMMGISSDRWSVYMRDHLGLGHLDPAQIRAEVLGRMVDIYRGGVPLLPGPGRRSRRSAGAVGSDSRRGPTGCC